MLMHQSAVDPQERAWQKLKVKAWQPYRRARRKLEVTSIHPESREIKQGSMGDSCLITEEKAIYLVNTVRFVAYLSMAAVARPPSQPGEDTPAALTGPSRRRVSRTEVDYRKLHRGTSTKETALPQASGKSSETSQSRLDTVLKVIAGVRESVDERLHPCSGDNWSSESECLGTNKARRARIAKSRRTT